MFRLPCIATAAAVLTGMAVASAAAQQAPLRDGAVARVGDEHISKREFRHWLRIAVTGDPHAKREALRDSTMLYLLHDAWTRQEAAARGIVVKPARVRRAFSQRRKAFPDERAFRRFLRRSGMTRRDLLERLEFDMLQRRLTRAATTNVPAVTKEDVDRYYAQHRRRYSDLSRRTARRAIRAQLTATRQQRAVTRFLERFRSHYRAKTICAKRYVIDACSNAP